MVRSLRESLDAAQFKDWQMPATQFGGIHLGYAGLAFDSPFRNVKDYEDYLSRLHQIPRVLDQAIGHMRDGLARTTSFHQSIYWKKVSDQAQKIADDSLETSPFTDPLRKFPDSISEAQRKQLSDAINAAVKNEVAPAYAKFAKFVRDDYAPHAVLILAYGPSPTEKHAILRHPSSDDHRLHRRSDSSTRTEECCGNRNPDADHRQGAGIQRSEIV